MDKVERVAGAVPSFGPGNGGGFPGGGLPGLGGGGPVATAVVPATGAAVKLRLYLTVEPATMLGPVVTVLTTRSAELSDVHIGQPSLEDVFIELTGRGLR